MDKLVQMLCEKQVAFKTVFGVNCPEADNAINVFNATNQIKTGAIRALHNDIMLFDTTVRDFYYDVLVYIEENGYIPDYMRACV